MAYHHIKKNVCDFAHKNVSDSPNTVYTVAMILLVIVSSAHTQHSIRSTANSPNEDTVFYRLDTSIRQLQTQFWTQSLQFLRRRKRKLRQVKCYLTVDETYDSYSGKLHKKPLKNMSKNDKQIRKYIHSYKPKKGDTGSFKYLVFALVYGKKKRVLYIKTLRRKEKYWSLVAEKLNEIYLEVPFQAALLDRGFYVEELVDKLEKNQTPYIIRAKLSDSMKKIYGIFRRWKVYDYKICNNTQCKLVLGRDFLNRPWGFITNLQDVKNIRKLYAKRWNIENIFKATDGIQLRVSTSNHITRLFAVCLSFLIYNSWQKSNNRPTLLDFIKRIIALLLHNLLTCPYRDRFRLNTPFWDFIDY